MTAFKAIQIEHPPNRCVFCSRSDVTFRRLEHAISESLGGDIVIPCGWVCDASNQYFGAKVESKVLGWPPFSLERVFAAVPTKKGKRPIHQDDGFAFAATGQRDTFYVIEQGNRSGAIRAATSPWYIPKLPLNYDDFLARFLLKTGLELLLSQGWDVSDSRFNRARKCARSGELAGEWDVSYGICPQRSTLYRSSRYDELGRLDTHQLYQWAIGVMDSGDVIFNFAYSTHVFACNLSRPPNTEYMLGFNTGNSFTLRSRWNHISNSEMTFRAAPRKEYAVRR